MNVYVVGSFEHTDAVEIDKFKTTCKNIGRWLHDKDTIIVTGTLSPSPQKLLADEFVIKGAIEDYDQFKQKRGKELKIKLFSVRDDDTLSNQNPILDDLKKRNVEPIISPKAFRIHPYIDAYNKALENADVVITIGGSTNTEEICNLALENRKKPVISFDYFKGSSETFYHKLFWVYNLSGFED